jgi:photosystem II stability/assembly factor-like uncharacterized protein
MRLFVRPMQQCKRAVLALAASAYAAGAQAPVLTVQQSQTTALLQAVSVSARNQQIVWVSGHAGTYAKSSDGGSTWSAFVMPTKEKLQFRDLHAIDGDRAWLMAAGTGAASGIFATRDGGHTWTASFVNRDTSAFYDCMAFFDETHGFAFSDAVNSRMPIVSTSDGERWIVSDIAAQDGEGGFAASGTCAIATGASTAFIATGSAPTPRVLRTTDRGATWTAAALPLVGGTGAGATAVAFRDNDHGVALGGVIGGTAVGPRASRSSDGGRTWTLANDPPFAGAVYGAAYAQTSGGAILVAVGPGGAAYTRDDANTWTMLDAAAYWSVGFGSAGAGWMVGPKGRIVRIDWR